MKNRKILSLLSLPMMVGLLASCGGNSTTSEKPTTVEESTTSKETTTSITPTTSDNPTTSTYVPFITEPTTIDLWSIVGDNNIATLNKFIDGFKTLEPNITVNSVKQTGMGYNELKAAVVNGFSSDAYPDLVQCYPDHVAEYIDYGKSLDVTKFMNNADYGLSAADLADYVPAYLDEGRGYSQDGMFSLPFQKSTEAMFYNADVLLNATHAQGIVDQDTSINGGSPINERYLNNLTWEELFNHLCPAIIAYNNTLDDAQKILKSDQSHHAVFAYDSDDNLFITLAEQYGYGYTSFNKTSQKGVAEFNNEGMKAVAKVFNKAANNGYIISKGSAGNNYTNTYFTKRNTLFSVGSTGGVKYQFDASDPMNVGVAIIPHAEGHDKKVISQGPSLAFLNHDDPNKALASWLFYKYMTNEQNAITWCVETGYQGVRKSVYESQAYLDTTDVSDKQVATLDYLKAKSLSYVTTVDDYLYTSPAFVGSSACRTAVGGLMTSILTKGTDGALLTDDKITELFSAAYNQATIAIK